MAIMAVNGFIKQDTHYVAFVGKGHRFCFLPGKDDVLHDNTDMGVPICVKIKSINGFITGETFEGNTILLYTGGDIELCPYCYAYVRLFIMARDKNSLEEFDEIEFKGGTLQEMADSELKRNRQYCHSYKVMHANECICYSRKFNINQYVSAFCRDNRAVGIVSFSISSSNKHDLKECVVSCYDYFMTLLKFMAFRSDVGVEWTHILKNNRVIAECFSDTDCRTHEKAYNSSDINFEYLGRNVDSLLGIIGTIDTDDPKINIEFIPESVQSRYIINANKIRDICTALESEGDRQEYTFSDSVKKVSNEVKKFLKKECQSYEKLSQKQKAYISSNLKYWTNPFMEKAESLLKRYKSVITVDISADDISQFKRLRDNITHASATESDDKNFDTAYALMQIIYASILDRCGCDMDGLHRFFEKGFMQL